jgi:FlgD Ig-like domain/F5/8 type C domain
MKTKFFSWLVFCTAMLLVSRSVIAQQNLSIGAIVQTSSNYSASFTGTQAIDGNLTTKWTSNGATFNSWLALDLRQNCSISRVTVKNAQTAGDPWYFNTKACQVETGNSINGPWSVVAGASFSNLAQTSPTFTSAVSVTARYVRLNVTNPGPDNYARIQEFEVIGTPATCTAPSGLARSTPACSGAGYTVNFNWQCAAGNGWWIDISADPNFGSFYNKPLSVGTTATTNAGVCLMAHQNGCNLGGLTLQPNTTYYWRIWNGSFHTVGQSFNVPACASSSCTNIMGIHWWDASASAIMNGKKGWSVETVNTVDGYTGGWGINAVKNVIGGMRAQGLFEPIVRINYNMNGQTIPVNPADYPAFAQNCRTIVAELSQAPYNVKYFTIGNEFNGPGENRGQPGLGVSPANYSNCFKQCYNTIKASYPGAKVLVGAVAPYTYELYSGVVEKVFYDKYFYDVVAGIGNSCDGYTLHAYSNHGNDITNSNFLTYGRTIPNTWGFDVFQVFMEVLKQFPSFATSKPVFITETNTFHGFSAIDGSDAPSFTYSSGWMQQSYNKIINWNNNNTQKIYALCWFVYKYDFNWRYFNLMSPVGNLNQAKADFSAITASPSYNTVCTPPNLVSRNSAIEAEANGTKLLAGINFSPNPFNNGTSLNYSLEKPAITRIHITDISGKTVKTINNGKQGPGNYTVSWNGRNEQNWPLPAGTYLVTVQAGTDKQVLKVSLTR